VDWQEGRKKDSFLGFRFRFPHCVFSLLSWIRRNNYCESYTSDQHLPFLHDHILESRSDCDALYSQIIFCHAVSPSTYSLITYSYLYLTKYRNFILTDFLSSSKLFAAPKLYILCKFNNLTL